MNYHQLLLYLKLNKNLEYKEFCLTPTKTKITYSIIGLP